MTRVDPGPRPAADLPLRAARRLAAALAALAGLGAWRAASRRWRRLLALTRLSPRAVCEESAGLGRHDYHTHADDADGAPWGTVGGARCARCGKRYRL